MRLKFIHMRVQEFGHLLACGGTTIGYFETEDDYGHPVFHVTAAWCNLQDHYCKRIGRAICQARMEQGRFIEVEVLKDAPIWKLRKPYFGFGDDYLF